MFWSMILCLLPVLIIGAGIYYAVAHNEEGGAFIMAVGIAGCIIIFLTMFFGRINGKAEVGKFEAMQTTLDSQRMNNARMENASVTLEIVHMNKWLAGAKYKGKILSFWYPKEIYGIKPIK